MWWMAWHSLPPMHYVMDSVANTDAPCGGWRSLPPMHHVVDAWHFLLRVALDELGVDLPARGFLAPHHHRGTAWIVLATSPKRI
jgi:hypothetical protein